VRQENENENGNNDKKEQADEQVQAPGTGNRWRKDSKGIPHAVHGREKTPEPDTDRTWAGPGNEIMDGPDHGSGTMSRGG